jgi:2-polyprenyl-6-methoxyphenol hydroxylase-like FAD-dependent oxidoreductase
MSNLAEHPLSQSPAGELPELLRNVVFSASAANLRLEAGTTQINIVGRMAIRRSLHYQNNLAHECCGRLLPHPLHPPAGPRILDIIQEKRSLSRRLGRQAVVIGAGMAGMPAARVLADHFDRVIVIENDTLPADASPRPGTPQSKHLHALLAGGQRALSSLFPGFEEDLVAAGAQKYQVSTVARYEFPGYESYPNRDLGFASFCMTRPLLESVVRKHFLATGNVTTHQRCRAQRLITSEDGSRVIGVSCLHADGPAEEMHADLVIDASSNGQLTLNLLAALGISAPKETTVGVDIGYSTMLFEIPQDAPTEWRAVATYPDPPRNRLGAILLPVEGNRWIVTVAGGHDCKPADGQTAFMECAQQLRTQTIYNAIRNAPQCGPAVRYGFKASRWRHFEALERLPSGLIPFGDTICRFNPIYGQGMSVAAKEACLLRDLLQAAAEDGEGFESVPGKFLGQAQPIIDAPWATAVIPDFLDPLTAGERPPDLEGALKFGAALRRLAYEDGEIHRLMLEVQHMIKPRSILREPAIVERIKAVMARDEMPSEVAG